MWWKSVALVGLPGVNDHPEISVFLSNKENADQRPDPQAEGQESSVSQRPEEAEPELTIAAESDVPVRSEKPIIGMDVGELLITEADQVGIQEH